MIYNPVSILAADIGGTNARFARFTAGGKGELTLAAKLKLPTREAPDLAGLLDKVLDGPLGLGPGEMAATALAVAGPVSGGRHCSPPNIPWEMDLDALGGRLGKGPRVLVNDFVALAHATLSPLGRSAGPVLPGREDPKGVMGVIGAGTGLGHAALIPDGRGGRLALASEGGHTGFPFERPEEVEYQRFLLERTGEPYIINERVVSGPGLILLHEFHTGQKMEADHICPILENDSPTLVWMARFYGRAARNFSLRVLPRGGLFIGGGVAAGEPRLVTHPAFGEEFHRSPTMRRLLETISVRLLTDGDAGLWGAARAALDLLDA